MFNNTLKFHSARVTLLWRYVGILASHITGNSSFNSYFILQANIKQNIEALHIWPSVRESTEDSCIPTQVANNAASVFMSWDFFY